jgi:hypothetical protein
MNKDKMKMTKLLIHDDVKTNEEQTEGMEENKGLVSRWGYRKTLLGVLIAGVAMALALFRGC